LKAVRKIIVSVEDNMFFKSNFFRFACSLFLLLSLSILTFADTIRLKDGSIIKGKITNFTGGKFVVSIGEGSRQRQMSFSAEEIESISFDAPTAPTNSPKTSNQTNVSLPVAENSPKADNTVITVGENNRTSIAFCSAANNQNRQYDTK
jgi:hypothetical protein